MVRESESERHAMWKEVKCCILTQNHSIEVAIIIVLLCWQIFMQWQEKTIYRQNDYNCSLSIHFNFWIEMVCVHALMFI